MRNKILVGLIIGMSISGFGDLAMAKPVGKGKKSYCDGNIVNVKGTNKSDIIVINDDNTATVNGEIVTFGSLDTPVQAVVSGGNGNDTITGSSFDDIICGGNGQDIIYGKDGSDRIFGQNGKDELYGDDAESSCVPLDPEGPDGLPDTADDVSPLYCDDFIEGGNAKDYIEGGDGDDILEGNNASDEIKGGFGSDTLDGGNGKDICSYSDAGDFDDSDEEIDSEDNECEG
jgi:Ca2+-binding RTX toxin-like protein